MPTIVVTNGGAAAGERLFPFVTRGQGSPCLEHPLETVFRTEGRKLALPNKISALFVVTFMLGIMQSIFKCRAFLAWWRGDNGCKRGGNVIGAVPVS